jgi:hypothetical protein
MGERFSLTPSASMSRLPAAEDVIFPTLDLSDLDRHIRLHVRTMRKILTRFYALRKLAEKLPQEATQLTNSEEEEIGFTYAQALSEGIDLGLTKLFDKDKRALGFNRILKEYKAGSHDTELAQAMDKSIKEYRTKYDGLITMRNEALAHQEPDLQLNVLMSFVQREEAIKDAVDILDLFVTGGRVEYTTRISDVDVDLRSDLDLALRGKNKRLTLG